MTDATLRIKNLSIALAHLSPLGYVGVCDRIYILLQDTLKEEETKTATPPARPAIPIPDDNIPF